MLSIVTRLLRWFAEMRRRFNGFGGAPPPPPPPSTATVGQFLFNRAAQSGLLVLLVDI
jgi:hypothetical protein